MKNNYYVYLHLKHNMIITLQNAMKNSDSEGGFLSCCCAAKTVKGEDSKTTQKMHELLEKQLQLCLWRENNIGPCLKPVKSNFLFKPSLTIYAKAS